MMSFGVDLVLVESGLGDLRGLWGIGEGVGRVLGLSEA